MIKNKMAKWIFVFIAITVLIGILILNYKEKKLVSQIKNGNFSVIDESDVVSIEEVANTYKYMEQDIEWLYLDMNADGVRDLVLQEKNEYVMCRQVIGIFDIRQNGKCVFWDTMDRAEFYFITDNGNLVYYSQYFGVYCYISYKLCKCDREWNQKIEREICAYYIYDIENTLYWVGVDEHDHKDMTENGVYFKLIRDDIEATVSKDEFIEQFEEMIQRDYSILKHMSDLFWLYE